jgi:hypothetical protein
MSLISAAACVGVLSVMSTLEIRAVWAMAGCGKLRHSINFRFVSELRLQQAVRPGDVSCPKFARIENTHSPPGPVARVSPVVWVCGVTSNHASNSGTLSLQSCLVELLGYTCVCEITGAGRKQYGIIDRTLLSLSRLLLLVLSFVFGARITHSSWLGTALPFVAARPSLSIARKSEPPVPFRLRLRK